NDALMLAIMARQEKTAVLCLSHSFNTEANAAGKTALSLAAACDMPKLIAPLIAAGCDLAHQAAAGATPLMLAEEAGLTESFRVLLARDDIDLEAQDADGRTVLMRAITRGHRETIEALLLAGASASHNDRRSLSVMDFARRWGMEDMLRDAFEKYDVSL